jgi:hypothetical protein
LRHTHLVEAPFGPNNPNGHLAVGKAMM